MDSIVFHLHIKRIANIAVDIQEGDAKIICVPEQNVPNLNTILLVCKGSRTAAITATRKSSAMCLQIRTPSRKGRRWH